MSSSKKKGKKGRKGQGGTNKRRSDGGGEIWCPQVSDDLVEVIFVEEQVRFFKMLESANQCIPLSFLDDILIECYEKWKLHLPGLQAIDLVARAIPKFPLTESSFLDWNGVILVELKEEKVNLGLIPQWKNSEIQCLDTELKMKATLDSIDKKVEVATKPLQMILEVANKQIEVDRNRIEALERDYDQIKEEKEMAHERIKKLEQLLGGDI